MARSQARNNWSNENIKENNVHNHGSSDWQTLRSNLMNLLEQVESKVSHTQPSYVNANYNIPHHQGTAMSNGPMMQNAYQPPQPTYQQPHYPQHHNIQEQQLNSPVQPSHNGSNEQKVNLSSPNELNKFEGPNLSSERFDSFAQTLERISTRLELFEEKMNEDKHSSDDFKQIYAQVERLTQRVEDLPGNLGDKEQMELLEEQLSNIAQSIEAKPEPDFSNITKRIDDLALKLEQLIKIQEENSSQNAMEIGADFEEGMLSIKESVANIYDRIDSLNQDIAIDPQDIERLFQEMGAISSETAAISQEIENGKSGTDINEVLIRIDALSEKIDLTKGDDEALGELRFELEGLYENVRSALDPSFSLIEKRIKDISDSLKKSNGEISIERIEGQIKELISHTNQTTEQLNIITRLHQNSEQPTQIQGQDALVEHVTQRAIDAMSSANHISENNIIESLDNRLLNLTKILSDQLGNQLTQNNQAMSSSLDSQETTIKTAQSNQFNASIINESSRSVEEALDEIRRSFLQDDNANDKYVSPSHENHESHESHESHYEPTYEQEPNLLEQEFGSEINYTEPDENEYQHNENQHSSNDEYIGFDELEGEETGHSLSKEFDIAIKRTPSEFNEQAKLDIPSDIEQGEQFLENNEPINEEPIDVGVESEEQPAKPNSIFDVQNNSSFAQEPLEQIKNESELNKQPINNQVSASSKNTFIEAARRAAQRQNNNIDINESQSPIARAFSRFQNNKDKKQKDVKATQKIDKQELDRTPEKASINKKAGINIINSLKSLIASKKSKKQTPKIEKVALSSAKTIFLSRYFRSFLLAGLLVLILISAFYFISKRNGDMIDATANANNTSSIEQISNPNQITNSKTQLDNITPQNSNDDPMANPLADPMIDNGATSSINSTPVNVSNSPRVINQAVPPPLSSSFKEAEPKVIVTKKTEIQNTGGLIDENITTNSINNKNEIIPTQELVKVFTPSPIDLELPNEKIGPIALRQAAADGDPRAQFEVGAIYGEGKALKQDFASAAVWYERAAAQGFAPAGLRLGGLYESGKGVEKNLEQAKLWYQRAAEAKNRMAMHNLASIYAGGALGEQKFLEATEWFERAAKNGLTDSQFNLGMLHARGLGVKQDLQTAYYWFSIAANSGDKDAAKARDDIARSLNSDVIMQLQTRISTFKHEEINIRANFAPIGTWAKDFNPGPVIKEKGVVKKVQTALSKLGYDVGTPDGLMGPRTKEAIKEFENATGMSPSGAINPRLLAVLGSQPV